MQFLRTFKTSLAKRLTYSMMDPAKEPSEDRETQVGRSEDDQLFQMAHRGHWDQLIKHFPLPSQPHNNHKKTLLHLAVQYAPPEVVAKMLSFKHPPVNHRDLLAQTPLHRAVLRNSLQIVRMLLFSGAQANLTDLQGNTALHLAAAVGSKQIINQLLQFSISIIKNKYGVRPSCVCDCSVLRNILLAHQANFNQRLFQKIQIYDYLGKGSFGTVFLVEIFNKLMALKQIEKPLGSGCLKYLISQKNIMISIKHQHILNLYATLQTKSAYYLLLQYCPYQNLAQIISKKTLSEPQLRKIVKAICLALKAIHSKGWIYRDLKPQNILFSSAGTLKLADFGLSKNLEVTKTTHSFCGSLSYVAPQILSLQGYNHMVDWYMLGVLVVQCLTGQTPQQGQPVQKLLSGSSRSLIDFAKKLLQKNPKRRLGGRWQQVMSQTWMCQKEEQELQLIERQTSRADLKRQFENCMAQTQEWQNGWEWFDSSCI